MDFKYKTYKNYIHGDISFQSNVLETILKNRDVENPNLLLNVNESVLEDYKDYDNIMLAANKYKYHIENESRKALIVDSDSDGYTSSAEFYVYSEQLCNHLGKKLNIDILIHPERTHGLTDYMMDILRTEKYDVLYIPDAGSTDFKQHEELSNLGTEIIILDHHHSDKGYSNDAIVVNNQLSDKINNKAMTGVGVVYKFNQLLDEMFNVNFADDYLDLVAVGLVADY